MFPILLHKHMLSWVSSWWVQPSSAVVGPARNAPNGGIDIRKFFEQKATQVMLVSEDEIVAQRNALRKTIINERPPLSQRPRLFEELDQIFQMGYKAHFEARRKAILAAPVSPPPPPPPSPPTYSQILLI